MTPWAVQVTPSANWLYAVPEPLQSVTPAKKVPRSRGGELDISQCSPITLNEVPAGLMHPLHDSVGACHGPHVLVAGPEQSEVAKSSPPAGTSDDGEGGMESTG